MAASAIGNGLGGGDGRARQMQRRRLRPASRRDARCARGRPVLQPLRAPPPAADQVCPSDICQSEEFPDRDLLLEVPLAWLQRPLGRLNRCVVNAKGDPALWAIPPVLRCSFLHCSTPSCHGEACPAAVPGLAMQMRMIARLK